MRYLLVPVLAVLTCGAAFAQAPAHALPPGPGQKLVSTKCSMCHTLDRVTSLHQDRKAWQATVEQMNAKGAGLSPNQLKMVVAYLSKHFGESQSARNQH